MGNFGDALKKAGVISEKDLKRQRHEGRVERKQLGNEGVAAKNARQAEEARQRQNDRRNADRATEQSRQQALSRHEAIAQARDLIRSHSITKSQGRRRFHYEEKDGRLPYLLVDDALLKQLEDGRMGIATDGVFTHVVPGDIVRRLEGLFPDALLHPRPRAVTD